MIKSYLKLMRVQSLPLTVCIIAGGFMLEKGTLMDLSFITLAVSVSLGHLGFYTMNEIMDVEWDIEMYETDKPLVSGEVSMKTAVEICFSLVLGSVILAVLSFPLDSFIIYLFSCLIGALYNARSKRDTLSSLYLGVWAVSILLTGYYYGGGV